MLPSSSHMGIFDRFSRLVRAELSHRIGGRSSVDPASWRASKPRARPAPEPSVVRLPAELLSAFEALGVEPTADHKTARSAYLKALKAHHPDRHQDDEAARARATDQSARLNQAWDLIEAYYEAQPNSTT